jgi:hypothetical protein
MAAVGMRRILEPDELVILVRDREAASALPRKISAMWRAYFGSDDLERAEPLPEGFSWPWLRDHLTGDTEADAVAANLVDFEDMDQGVAFGALCVRLRELLRKAAPIRYRQVGTGVEIEDPSDTALAKFRRVWGVVDDPLRAITDTSSGILTAGQVVALKVAYPGLYGQMRDSAFQALAARVAGKPGYRIPWHKDVPLRRFLGSWRWDHALARELQAALQAAQASPGGASSGPLPRPLPMAPNVFQTPVERIQGK